MFNKNKILGYLPLKDKNIHFILDYGKLFLMETKFILVVDQRQLFRITFE